MKIYYFENRGFALIFDEPSDGAELAAKVKQGRCIRTKTYGPDRVGGQVLGAGRLPLMAWAAAKNDVVGIWAVAATSARIAQGVMADAVALTHLDGFEIAGDGETVQVTDVELLASLSVMTVPGRRYHPGPFHAAPRGGQRALSSVS